MLHLVSNFESKYNICQFIRHQELYCQLKNVYVTPMLNIYNLVEKIVKILYP